MAKFEGTCSPPDTRAAFAKLDKDSTGFLDRQHFALALRGLRPSLELPPPILLAAMDFFDTDDNAEAGKGEQPQRGSGGRRGSGRIDYRYDMCQKVGNKGGESFNKDESHKYVFGGVSQPFPQLQKFPILIPSRESPIASVRFYMKGEIKPGETGGGGTRNIQHWGYGARELLVSACVSHVGGVCPTRARSEDDSFPAMGEVGGCARC